MLCVRWYQILAVDYYFYFFQFYSYIFSNASSVLKPRQSSIFKLPRVSTPKSFAAPPRVSPSTQKIHNISPTTQKHRRDLRSAKSKTSPKNHIFLPSPDFKSNPIPSTSSFVNTDAAFTIIHLPFQIKHLFQQEINRDSNPSINSLPKINAVLDATTGKILIKKINEMVRRQQLYQCLLKVICNTCTRTQQYNTKGTNTLFCINTKQLPKNKKPMYLFICVNF